MRVRRGRTALAARGASRAAKVSSAGGGREWREGEDAAGGAAEKPLAPAGPRRSAESRPPGPVGAAGSRRSGRRKNAVLAAPRMPAGGRRGRGAVGPDDRPSPAHAGAPNPPVPPPGRPRMGSNILPHPAPGLRCE